MGLICIYLITSKVEHLFICLLDFLLCFYELLVHILISLLEYLSFITMCTSSLYLLDINPLFVLHVANIPACYLSF